MLRRCSRASSGAEPPRLGWRARQHRAGEPRRLGRQRRFIRGGRATAGVALDGTYVYWANYGSARSRGRVSTARRSVSMPGHHWGNAAEVSPSRRFPRSARGSSTVLRGTRFPRASM